MSPVASHLYLSPHLDDAILSCGGLIARQAAAGESVLVVTICAGDPGDGPLSEFAQALHTVWGAGASPVGDRRSEDRVACGRLDASVLHLEFPDAIYRRGPDGAALYDTDEALLGPLASAEAGLVQQVADRLGSICSEGARIYSPLAIGGHVDHRLTRAAAERLPCPIWYYRDFPYAARTPTLPSEFAPPAGRESVLALSAEEIQTWAAAVAEYRSQISSFWQDVYALYQEIRTFHDQAGGVVLAASKGTAEAIP
jgi:LmbE family N-acetylglucosaminyl deacetylase